MNTEILGTSTVESLIAPSNLLSPEISKNDKGLSWDGYIYVFKTPKDRQSKNNLLFRVPVQVKGHERTGIDDFFDIELSDLRNYQAEGGTLFFKICVDKDGKNPQTFYKALLPGDCRDILEKAKGEKTTRVLLDPVPEDVPSAEAILTNFANAMLEHTKESRIQWADYAPQAFPPRPEPPALPPKPVDPYQYNAGVLPFHGRENEMETLRAFLDDDRSFCWWAIVGPGGAGKTRLAYEFQKETKKRDGWTVQKLGVNSVKTVTELDPDAYLAEYPGQTLMILDYAQQHAKALGQWFHHLTAEDWDWRPGMKLRVLLLERADRDADGQYPWEKQLFQHANIRRVMEKRYADVLELSTTDKPLLDIMIDFASYLHGENDQLPVLTQADAASLLPQLEERKTPLFAMLLTDAWIHRALDENWNWETLLKNIIDRETGYLENRLQALCPENRLLENAAFELLRVATVLSASGAPTWENMAGLLPESLKAVQKAAEKADLPEEELLQRLGLMDGDGLHISPLRPDLFGEYMVLDWLRSKQGRVKDTEHFFEAILSDVQAATTFFLRTIRDFGPVVQSAGGGFHDWLIPAGMKLSSDEATAALVSLLRTLFDGAQVEGASWDAGAEKTTVFAKDLNTRLWIAQLMEEYTSGLMEDNLPVANALNDMASLYHAIGQLPKALEFFTKSMIIKETVLGKENPLTATAYNNLALVYKDIGDFPKALEYLNKALVIRETVLGRDHPSTATTYNNLAGVYRDMGDFPKALEYHKKALAIRETVLGREHPDTATTYNNLAGVYRALRDFPKALEYYNKDLAISETVLGRDHPDTATTYNNLAVVYQDMGDFPKALDYHNKALAIRETVLGREHPSTATTYNNLAGVYRDMGGFSKALEYYNKALAIRETVLGRDHPSTATTYNNLAGVYQDMGDFPKALDYFNKALAICETVLGRDHPDTATTYNNLAVVYQDMGDFPKALDYHNKALAIRETVLGRDHPSTATTYNNLAGVYRDMGGFPKALEYYNKALAICETVLGRDHPSTATTYNNLAGVYQDMGDFPKALDYYKKDLAISETVLGREHPDTAATYNNIGILYLAQNQPKQAIPWLERALSVFEAKLGPEHPYTQIAREALEYARRAGQ